MTYATYNKIEKAKVEQAWLKLLRALDHTRRDCSFCRRDSGIFRAVMMLIEEIKIISATLNTLKNILELQYSCEIILIIVSGKFSRAEIKLFHADVDESWNNFDIILFHM